MRVAARMLGLTAVIPRTNLTTLDLAGVKSCDLVSLALGTEAAGFPRHGILAPTSITFIGAKGW